MDELTYASVDQALADTLARARALRRSMGDEHAGELDLLCQLIEAIRIELSIESSIESEEEAGDGDAVHRNGTQPPMLPLTQREHEVLELMAYGLRNKEIATKLCIAERTAAFHVGNVLSKLGADGRVEAIYLARGRKLLRDSVFS